MRSPIRLARYQLPPIHFYPLAYKNDQTCTCKIRGIPTHLNSLDWKFRDILQSSHIHLQPVEEDKERCNHRGERHMNLWLWLSHMHSKVPFLDIVLYYSSLGHSKKHLKGSLTCGPGHVIMSSSSASVLLKIQETASSVAPTTRRAASSVSDVTTVVLRRNRSTQVLELRNTNQIGKQSWWVSYTTHHEGDHTC